MTIHMATQQLIFALFHVYEEREARNIADLVMEHITEWQRIDRVVNKQVPLSAGKQQLLARYTEELLSHKPVQYVLNQAWFCGMTFFVDERVLIPRPETEELVDWILKEGVVGENTNHGSTGTNQGGTDTYHGKATPADGPHILDVGTGSGCIAIALKKKRPGAVVYACDVSEQALEVARTNAASHSAGVSFVLCDFLNEAERMPLPAIDILVSNPPYIPENGKKTIHANVLQFEPELALFVRDENPLLFYDALAHFSQTHLSSTGAIFVEIHEDLGNAVTALFSRRGFRHIQLRKDLQGRDRMIRAGR